MGVTNEKENRISALISLCNTIKRQFNKTVTGLRSDNGTKFVNSKFLSFIQQGHEISCVSKPQQNGRIECKHRQILNLARALRFQANLPLYFLEECVLSVTYLINRTLTVADKDIIP